MWRIALITVIAAMLLVPRVSAQELQLVRVSYSGMWDSLPALVALERGYAAKNGILLSPVATPSADAIFASLNSGATDVAVVPQVQLLARSNGTSAMRAIDVNHWGGRHTVITGAQGPSTLAGLRGRRVGVLGGEDSLAVIVRALDASGVSADDLTLEQLTPTAFRGGLANGFDALVGPELIVAPLAEETGARVLVTGQELNAMLGYIGAQPLVASGKLIADQPDLATALQKTWAEAKAHIVEQPDDAARLLRLYLHRRGVPLTPEQAQQWVQSQRYDMTGWPDNAISDSQYNAWALTEADVINARPEVEAYLQ